MLALAAVLSIFTITAQGKVGPRSRSSSSASQAS